MTDSDKSQSLHPIRHSSFVIVHSMMHAVAPWYY